MRKGPRDSYSCHVENHARAKARRTFMAVFADVEAATEAVSTIIASGIVPGAIEMMDQLILRAVEDAFTLAFPPTQAQFSSSSSTD